MGPAMTEPALRFTAQPLTDAAFAPFGRVLQAPPEADHAAAGESINAGTARRFELLADAALTAAGGRPVISLSRACARPRPLVLTEVERHVLGSQSFVPLGAPRRFALVVAPPGPAPRPAELRAFVSDGTQGVWLAPGTWHHPLLALDAGDFLVIERRGAEVDCEVCPLPPGWVLALPG